MKQWVAELHLFATIKNRLSFKFPFLSFPKLEIVHGYESFHLFALRLEVGYFSLPSSFLSLQIVDMKWLTAGLLWGLQSQLLL